MTEPHHVQSHSIHLGEREVRGTEGLPLASNLNTYLSRLASGFRLKRQAPAVCPTQNTIDTNPPPGCCYCKFKAEVRSTECTGKACWKPDMRGSTLGNDVGNIDNDCFYPV